MSVLGLGPVTCEYGASLACENLEADFHTMQTDKKVSEILDI